MTTAPRILLVEDDPEQARLFGKVLRSVGDIVDVAATAGADAWYRKSDGVIRLRQVIQELLSQSPDQD